MESRTRPEVRADASVWTNVGGVAVVALGAVLVVMSQNLGPADAAGDPIGIIAPPLWRSRALYLVIVFTAVALALDLSARRSTWGFRHAIANATLSALFIGPVVWLATTGGIFNGAYFAAIGWPSGAVAATWVVTVLAAWMAANSTVIGFVRARGNSTS